MPYLRVALDVPLPRLFDYRLDVATAADIGRRVVVPFGTRRLVGVVLEMVEQPAYDVAAIKTAEAVLDDMPTLPAGLLDLFRFCADYYQHPIGQVLHTALPTRFRDPNVFRVAEALHYRAVDVATLLASLPRQAALKLRLAQLLATPRNEAEIRAAGSTAWKTVQVWLDAGLVVAQVQQTVMPSAAVGPPLNDEQAHAVAAITAATGFAAFLVHGITGSGKTEVYLNAIAATLARGQQALVLVPEINLTPQLEGRFRQRFPGVDIVSLNSSVAEGERAAGWVRAARGEAGIVLGTRLAVFTPAPRLGLIVVDEEHDASFKQHDGLRYSARDVAVYRARQAGVPIVLGSATPALESWQNAEAGRYRRLQLTQRAVAGALPPTLHLLSTKRQPLSDGMHARTLAAIGERLARGEQSLVFLNRRGYAPVMHCSECGWMAACTRCSARLTVHLRERQLRCHHCGAEDRLPRVCPGCGNQDMKPLGQGTQRLEDMLAEHFPAARVLRIDRDSTRRKGSFETALKAVHACEVDILVGTQMLAKGHDFPNLTLVAVIGADNGLYSANFRASERLYAQLAQVAGRAGRADKPGEVLLQTDFPEHPLYQALLADDYAFFAAGELAERKLAGFPPFLYQAVLRAEANQLAEALAYLSQAANLAPQSDAVTVWDPVAASMMRLANRERGQLLVQSTARTRLMAFLTEWMAALRAQKPGKVRWALDVDPLEL
ncbi:primosomal protein N' [Chitinimonas sp. BJB300]|uniref:primosomal protein N' n=1 Tax=Chitinimonas sp. BJB300 TaxID=1559339 RepID=UPI000C0E134E|nr:primosomal protein N' [Chitinimonas sp. BJB300]PHV12602.1 primosomal protein N' [Chitinimonas sp. BJB300]TSJ89919.1 primosomal protein N' [Chitinimonas sp. BJB300]